MLNRSVVKMKRAEKTTIATVFKILYTMRRAQNEMGETIFSFVIMQQMHSFRIIFTFQRRAQYHLIRIAIDNFIQSAPAKSPQLFNFSHLISFLIRAFIFSAFER